MPKTILGIDPGLTGALATITGDDVETYDMPVSPKRKSGHELNIRALSVLLREIAPDIAFLERQQPRPGNGAKAAFTAGHTYGVIEALLLAQGIPYQLVTPQKWKGDLLDGEPKDDKNPKAPSLRVARRLFPLADLGRRKDAGRAEALLLAYWGRCHGGIQ